MPRRPQRRHYPPRPTGRDDVVGCQLFTSNRMSDCQVVFYRSIHNQPTLSVKRNKFFDLKNDRNHVKYSKIRDSILQPNIAFSLYSPFDQLYSCFPSCLSENEWLFLSRSSLTDKWFFCVSREGRRLYLQHDFNEPSVAYMMAQINPFLQNIPFTVNWTGAQNKYPPSTSFVLSYVPDLDDPLNNLPGELLSFTGLDLLLMLLFLNYIR